MTLARRTGRSAFVVVGLVAVGLAAGPAVAAPPLDRAALAAEAKAQFLHAWRGYERHAWGHDELQPLSKAPRDWYGETLLTTPIDALDALVLLGLEDEAKKDHAYVVDSPTGLPWTYVNLKTGAVREPITNPAEAGTLLLEFGTLARPTGKPVYYEKAKKALVAIYEPHLTGRIDSYYEYLLKAWKLFGDEDCRRMWESHRAAIHRYLADEVRGELWYGYADMDTGKRTRPYYGALDAFFPAVLVLDGDLDRAKRLHRGRLRGHQGRADHGEDGRDGELPLRRDAQVPLPALRPRLRLRHRRPRPHDGGAPAEASRRDQPLRTDTREGRWTLERIVFLRVVFVLLSAAILGPGCGGDGEPTTPAPSPTPRPVSLTLTRTLTHGNDANAIAFSPDGQVLASGGGDIGEPGTVKLWSTASWGETVSFPGFFRSVYSLAFLPGGGFLVGGGYEAAGRDLTLWEVPGGHIVWQHDRYMPRSVAVSPDGQWLAIASANDPDLEIVALPSRRIFRVSTAHSRSILALAFSPDGRRLASGGADHVVKVWRVPDFTEEVLFVGHTAPVWSVAFSPDGQYVASGTIDSTARIWRVSDRSAFRTYHQEDWVWAVAFSPDGEFLASGGNVPIRLYRVGSAATEPVASAGATEDATALLFSPDGRYLVSALADNVQSTPGAIKVWSVSR